MAPLARPGPPCHGHRRPGHLEFLLGPGPGRLGGRGLYVAPAVPARRGRRRRRKAAAAQCPSQLIHGVNLNKSPCSTRVAEQRSCGDLRLSLHWKGLLFIARARIISSALPGAAQRARGIAQAVTCQLARSAIVTDNRDSG